MTALATAGYTGAVAWFARTTAPTGWLKANGSTIGNASSGASRANADTESLFNALWADTTLAILTSAGAGSTRGASAAADWAAHKRLTLPDLRGEFVRGLDDGRGIDSGRGLASAQAEMIGPHTHPISNASSVNNGSASKPASSNNAGAAVTVDQNAGTENRPRNVALLACIHL